MNNTSLPALSGKPGHGGSSSPDASLFTIGADLFGQVQKVVGKDQVRGLRIKLGSRVIREVPIGALSAAATIGLVLLAVVVSTLSIEVEHEPASRAGSEAKR